MKTHRTVRYRLHPGSRAKARLLAGTAGACRYVWNHFVGVLRDEYRETGRCDYRYFTVGKQFTALRRQVPWLGEYAANIVKRSLQPLETAYTKAGKGTGGVPQFKGKYEVEASFPLVAGTFRVYGTRYVHVAKVGTMRVCGRNPYGDGQPVSGTVKREAGQWYVYVVYEVERTENVCEQAVGVDRNVGQVTCSDGMTYAVPVVKRLEARQRRYQRMMARRRRGSRKVGTTPSKRYLRAKALAAKAAKKRGQVRANWCHQVSRVLANQYGRVYLEALTVKGMTAKGKGKRGLNRGILESVWGKLEQCLGYKTTVAKVPAAYTSQRCHGCGHRDERNRVTRSDFRCVKCGLFGDADVNAALNILALGNGAAGRGGGNRSWPVKRQKEAWDPSADGAT